MTIRSSLGQRIFTSTQAGPIPIQEIILNTSIITILKTILNSFHKWGITTTNTRPIKIQKICSNTTRVFAKQSAFQDRTRQREIASVRTSSIREQKLGRFAFILTILSYRSSLRNQSQWSITRCLTSSIPKHYFPSRTQIVTKSISSINSHHQRKTTF